MKIQVEVTDEQHAALQSKAGKKQKAVEELVAELLVADAAAFTLEEKRAAIYVPVRAAEAVLRAAQAAAHAEEIQQGLIPPDDERFGRPGGRGLGFRP